MTTRQVRITDVAPRDGLQNEPRPIPTDQKLRLIRKLCAARVDQIEVTSFVSPKWIPQLADAAEVLEQAAAFKPPSVAYCVLVPNERGMERALAVHTRTGGRALDRVAVFTAASETFSQRNTNATIDETLGRFEPVVRMARDAGLAVRGYVSCAVACPFEGPVAPSRVADVAEKLRALGVDELDLADTIGVATPADIERLLAAVFDRLGDAVLERLTLHLHDTHGRARECVRAALKMGVRSFDGAVGGLGGCPYASTPQRRAPGNVATRLLVRVIDQAGYRTNIDVAALDEAARLARSLGCGPSGASP